MIKPKERLFKGRQASAASFRFIKIGPNDDQFSYRIMRDDETLFLSRNFLKIYVNHEYGQFLKVIDETQLKPDDKELRLVITVSETTAKIDKI
jgi:diacylglycerol kinase family enzyme